MSGDYAEFAPPAELRNAVSACWTGRGGTGRILPDGCIDLIFQSAGTGAARLFTSALLDRPLVIPVDPACWFAGLRFHPGMSRVVLDVDPGDCLNSDIAASLIDTRFRRLEAQLSECRCAQTALNLLRKESACKLNDDPNCTVPLRVRAAVRLLCSADNVRVAEAARAVGVSERSLHRDVVSWTGLRPSLLSRIFRMQRAIGRITTGRTGLADTAFEMGYADQAHMVREVRQLTGLAPSSFMRSLPV